MNKKKMSNKPKIRGTKPVGSGALYQMQTAIDAKPLIGSTATASSLNTPNP